MADSDKKTFIKDTLDEYLPHKPTFEYTTLIEEYWKKEKKHNKKFKRTGIPSEHLCLLPQVGINKSFYAKTKCLKYNQECQILLQERFGLYKLYLYYDGISLWDFIIFGDNKKVIRPYFDITSELF